MRAPDADGPGPALTLERAPHVLRDYALIADGERGALVGPQGDIAWMCAPRWDSDAAFSGLLGGAGTYIVAPRARRVWGGYYEDGTLIWRSRWVTDDGIAECREALAHPGARDRAVILRRIIAADAPARMRIVLSLRAGFGHHDMTDLTCRRGVWQARSGPLGIAWHGAGDAHPVVLGDAGHALALELVVPARSQHDLVLEIAAGTPRGDPPDTAALWTSTEAAWRADVPRWEDTLAPRDARQAGAVLRGLTAPSGGTVAAVTLGLPERAREGRNYDYRYVWVRDQCFAGQALAAAGAWERFDPCVRFVCERLEADGARLKPAYTADGAAVPDERPLALPGYPGARAVCGNHANAQHQLDVFGEALLLLAAAARHDRLDGAGRRAMEVAVDAIALRWRESDAGIWEIDDRAWTHSRLMCVAGLRAASPHVAPARASAWEGLADAIHAETAATSLHPSGRWQRSPDDERIDAALLLPAVHSVTSGDDPRAPATLAAVLEELSEDGFAYRFRPDGRPLGEAEGAFLLCGFAVALAAHRQGDTVRAVHWFERTRGACGSPGLFSEEYDTAQRQLRGNLPQMFVHALLLECACRLRAAPE